MADNILQERDSDNSQPRLQNKPNRRSGWRAGRKLSSLLLLVGGVIIVGGGILLAGLLFSHSPASGSRGSAPATQVKQPSSACNGSRLPWDTVASETASGLHLTVAQVKAQVHAGKTIVQVAASQRISPEQLHTIEMHALQVANASWVRLGCITQQDANE